MLNYAKQRLLMENVLLFHCLHSVVTLLDVYILNHGFISTILVEDTTWLLT